VKEHPDCEPGCAEAVKGSNDDNGNCDQQFECKGIDDKAPQLKRSISHLSFSIYQLVIFELSRPDSSK